MDNILMNAKTNQTKSQKKELEGDQERKKGGEIETRIDRQRSIKRKWQTCK